MTDEPLTTAPLNPHTVQDSEKISPDGKMMRVQYVRATTDEKPSRIRCQDGTVYINNGHGQLLNPGRAMRKANAAAKKAKKEKK